MSCKIGGKCGTLCKVRPIDIGLPYLAFVSITMRRCDTYIHDPDSMLTCDLKVKFRGFCHVFMSDL